MNGYNTRDGALRDAPRHVAQLIDVAPDFPLCSMIVTRDGRQEPCERVTAAMVAYESDGAWWLNPMCVWHAHREGGQRNAVSLIDLLIAARSLP